MSLTLIVVINVALDAALLGGLAWALSRPARLTAHAAAIAPASTRRRGRRSAAHGVADWSVRTSRATA